MQFADLQELFRKVTVEIICDRTELFRGLGAIRLRKQEDSAWVHLTAENSPLTVTGEFATESYAESWTGVQNGAYLAQVSDIRGNRLVVTAVTGFFLRHRENPLEIAVTDAAGRKDHKHFPELKSHIERDYSFSHGGKTYVVMAKHVESRGKTFSIVNGRWMYAVEETVRGGVAEGSRSSEQIYAITKGETGFRRENYSVELWECGLRVCDTTTAGKRDMELKAYADKGIARYLELWEQYAQVEFDTVRQTAEQAGKLEYTILERSGHIALLKIRNPEYLNGFLKHLHELGTDDTVILPRHRKGVVSGVLVPREEQVEIHFRREEDCHIAVPEGMMLPDLRAAETQYNRRSRAFDRIRRGLSAKPELPMLISGENMAFQPKPRRMTPLSDLVIARCFPEHPPTAAQREAISIALNTPDFAIIQGPPGTGKTTVINAIMTALSEKEKDPEMFFGKNLLTAYQKETTAHLAEKLEIYGLPVITYKGRRRVEDGEHQNFDGEEDKDPQVTQWIREKREALVLSDERTAQYAEQDAILAKLKLLLVCQNPETDSREVCRSMLLALLENLLALRDGEEVKDRFLPQVERLLAEAEAEITGDDAARARLRLDRQTANDLPISPVSMADDGEKAVRKALRRFSADRYPPEIQQIRQVMEREYGKEPINYRNIRLLKNRLLANLRERSGLLSNERLNRRAAALLEEVIQALEQTERSDEDRIMADYVNAFSDEDGIKEAIKEFLTVIAATHQKAVAEEIRNLKDETDVVFENVLIDEAARSCPPDLLIPLSCARDRMILVGDHRQLPQFVSDKVYDAIEAVSAQAGAEKRSIIKDKPMFLHLIEQVRKLERDGVKRFIRLDSQFRMPKTLGDLVSEFFYENGLDSPRGNEGFDTGLKYIKGLHLAWLDVPGRPGEREEKDENNSYFRRSEAERAINMLHSIIRDSGEAANRYTYGVMTFYNGQKKRLERLIRDDSDLREMQENGSIKVGTVDAFQGMEFDVVILSVVRSNTDYTNQKKRYGFTMDEHRLCVALSRAMKCMIVVGDSRMMSGKAAQNAIPALVKFYQLCKNKEVPDARVFKDNSFLYQAEGS